MLDNHSANRCIVIDCDLGDALAFTGANWAAARIHSRFASGEAANLPAWTYFFRKEIKRERDRIRFDTPLGECLTRIRTKQGKDSVRLRFTPNDKGQTLASFYAMFPPSLPIARRTAMLAQIERELLRLKALLEPKYNCRD